MRIKDEHVVWREVDDQIVLLDLDGSTYFRLNDSAAVLWRQIIGGADEAALPSVLVDTYSIPPERAAAEVAEFLDALEAKGMVER